MRSSRSSVFLFFVTFCLVLGYLSTAAAADPREEGISPDQVRAEMDQKNRRVMEIEVSVMKMAAEAVKEKDIRWKLCLDDIIISIKGIVASVSSAKDRAEDLLRAEKYDTARSQLMLVRGLADSAEKSLAESQACQRQLTKVDNSSVVEKEENSEVTGTYTEEGGVEDAMGGGFGDEFVVGRDRATIDASDPLDGAGTDNVGGPGETPGSVGGGAGVSGDYDDTVSVPPFVTPSPEL